jgi:hippurate hydrolase
VRIDEGYPVTRNDPRAIDLVRDIAERQEPGSWRHMPAPMMGGEDFSYVLREVPGAMAFLGAAPAGSDAAANPPLHNTRMTIDESVMARGVALHCAFAQAVLDGGLPAA